MAHKAEKLTKAVPLQKKMHALAATFISYLIHVVLIADNNAVLTLF